MKKHKTVLGLLFCVGLALLFFRLDVYAAETTSDSTVIDAGNPIDSGNRVWFFNVCGETYASDFIAVESNGRWGLIDAGFRKADTIQDIDGTVLSVPMNDPETKREYYSCSVKGKNGVDAARYMVETLGVTHLDFIIISHAHLDHNGGIPEIAELRVKDSKGVHSLIDKNTICLKKKYWHIKGENSEMEGLQDNLDEQNRLNGFNHPRCWQSQAFDYQAEQAVAQNGGIVVDISKGLRTSDKKQKNNNYKGIIDAISGSGVFSDVKYDQGDLSDYYDDYLDMQFGTFQMRLYNLYGTLNAIDDNQNSIAVVISNGKKQLFTAGDLNVIDEVQQKVIRAVSKSFKNVEVMKTCDHGWDRGISKELVDTIQPRYLITTHGRGTTKVKYVEGKVSSYIAAIAYSERKYGTVSYEVGASDKGIVAEFDDKGIALYQFSEKNGKTIICKGKNKTESNDIMKCKSVITLPAEKWVVWKESIHDGKAEETFMFFKNSKVYTGWRKSQNKQGKACYYYLGSDGLIYSGWLKYGGEWYYLGPKWDMTIGWKKIKGIWYYFHPTGEMAHKEWISGYWIDKDGAYDDRYKAKWKKENGKWKYVDNTGWYAKKSWQRIDAKWYYFDEKGYMVTGKQLINGKTYVFDKDGALIG